MPAKQAYYLARIFSCFFSNFFGDLPIIGMMAPAPFQIGLFQLSVQAWLSPQAVAQAVQKAEYSELVSWAQQTSALMSPSDFEPNHITRFKRVTLNLESAVAEENLGQAYRAREKLARLIAGVRDGEKLQRLVQHAKEAQGLGILAPASVSTIEKGIKDRHKVIPNFLKNHIPPAQWSLDEISIVSLALERLPTDTHYEFRRLVKHRDFPEICRRAMQNGYLFIEALEYCVSSEDPLKEAGLLEATILKFKSRLPRIRRFRKLWTHETLALYVLARESSSKRNPPTPFIRFERFIEMAILFSDLKDLSDIFNPQSLFNQLAGREFSYNPFGKAAPLMDHLLPYYEGGRFFYYDTIAQIVHHPSLSGIHELFNVPSRLMRRAHRVFLNAKEASIKVFFQNLSSASSRKQIEAALFLVEEGIDSHEVATQFISFSDFMGAYRIYKRYFGAYLGNTSTPLAAFSPLEKMAAYRVINKILGDGKEVSWEEFEVALKVENSLARIRGEGISLADFAKRIARNKPGFFLEPDEGWVNSKLTSPYRILGFCLETFPNAPEDWFLKIDSILFQNNHELNVAFQGNIHFASVNHIDCFEAAIELLEEEVLIGGGPFFSEYLWSSNRREKIIKAKTRARELLYGASVGDMNDPFEMMAAWWVLQNKVSYDVFRHVISRHIVQGVKMPPRSKEVHSSPFAFRIHPLTMPPHVAVDKLSLYVSKLRNLDCFEGLAEEIENVLHDFILHGPVDVRDNIVIQGALKRMERLRFEVYDDPPQFEEDPRKRERLLEILEIALKFFSESIQKRVFKLMVGKDQSRLVQIRQRVVNEYMDFLGRLLVAWAFDQETDGYQRQDILSFSRKQATGEDIYRVLARLNHFFTTQLENAMNHFFSDAIYPLPSQIKLKFKSKKGGYHYEDVLKELDRMMDKQKNLKTEGETMEVSLFPDVGALACFYGYMSQNCLANEEAALYGMQDSSFVPYRIIVNHQWRGVVQTFTRVVNINGEKKKLLIVSGIDPQPDLLLAPAEFLSGLEKGFGEIADAGHYDFVVVPAKDFAQSSRRDFLRREFSRYQTRIQIDLPIGFPQIRIKPDGSPLYYSNDKYGEAQHTKFLVFRTAPK